jgi:hypothetical protein
VRASTAAHGRRYRKKQDGKHRHAWPVAVPKPALLNYHSRIVVEAPPLFFNPQTEQE